MENEDNARLANIMGKAMANLKDAYEIDDLSGIKSRISFVIGLLEGTHELIRPSTSDPAPATDKKWWEKFI